MREAVKHGDALEAPSVGTWRPAIGLGHPLQPGLLLGTLVRDGRPLTVHAPRDASGVATWVREGGAWLSFGEPLVRFGEGGLGLGAAVASAGVSGGPEGATAILAETDGTVYLSPDPASPSFAPVGAQVAVHGTLALIEVMKTFTPVRSPLAGTVARVDVATGEAVREGAVLFWVRRDA